MFLTFSECVYWSQLYLKRKFSPLTSNLAITGNYLFLRTILLRVISVSWPYLLVPCWKLFCNFLLQWNMRKTRVNFLKHMIQKTKILLIFIWKTRVYYGHSYLQQLTSAYRCRSKQPFEGTSTTSESTAINEEGGASLPPPPGHVTHL